MKKVKLRSYKIKNYLEVINGMVIEGSRYPILITLSKEEAQLINISIG